MNLLVDRVNPALMRREIGNVARRRGPRTSHFPFLTRRRYSS